MKNDWTKPAAMAIPKGGFFKDKEEKGRYGPIFPKTPACYGFSILAKIKPGTEQNFREYAKSDREGRCRDTRLPRCAQAALPALGALRHREATLTSCIRASSIPTSTSTRKMP